MAIRILVADDELIIADGVVRMIENTGLDATIVGLAYDGNQALNQICALKPDIAILDIEMPGKNGISILKEIKERKIETKVVFISAYQEFGYAKDALKFGAIEYILKPINQMDLELAIQKSLKWMGPSDVKKQPPIKDVIQLETIHAKSNEEIIKVKLKEMDIDIQRKTFVIGCITLSREAQMAYSGDEYELIRFSVFRLIQSYLKRTKAGIVINRDTETCIALIVIEKEGWKNQLVDVVGGMKKEIRETYHQDVIIGIGDNVHSISSVELAYISAKCTLDQIIMRGLLKTKGVETRAIQTAKNYINENFYKNISLDEVAKKVFMNTSYFSTYFKNEMGENFKTYLIRIRMENAEKLIIEGFSGTAYELAQRVGYNNARQFSDKFKEHFGRSPKEYIRTINM